MKKLNLLHNFIFQVKSIMEEAVTRKFVHEESSSITSLCGKCLTTIVGVAGKRSSGPFCSASKPLSRNSTMKSRKFWSKGLGGGGWYVGAVVRDSPSSAMISVQITQTRMHFSRMHTALSLLSVGGGGVLSVRGGSRSGGVSVRGSLQRGSP